MVLWLVTICGFLLMALTGVLCGGARAGPLRKSRRIDYLCTNERAATSAGTRDESPPVNVSPDMHHLMAPMAKFGESIHRAAGGVPA
jgi:hypothetical protein